MRLWGRRSGPCALRHNPVWRDLRGPRSLNDRKSGRRPGLEEIAVPRQSGVIARLPLCRGIPAVSFGGVPGIGPMILATALARMKLRIVKIAFTSGFARKSPMITRTARVKS